MERNEKIKKEKRIEKLDWEHVVSEASKEAEDFMEMSDLQQKLAYDALKHVRFDS